MAARKPTQPIPDDLDRESKNALAVWTLKRWPHHFHYRSVLKRFIEDEIDMCLNWHRMNGVERRDYVAAVRNWIHKTMAKRGYEPQKPPGRTARSLPADELSSLADALREMKEK